MRKLIYAINLTLDGCCDHTKGAPDEELYYYYIDLLNEADMFIYGRKTYQLMVPYWPDIANDHTGSTQAEIDYAEAFVGVDNMVIFSRSLDKAEGENTRIVNTNLKDEILRLKQQPGKNILTGGVDIPSQLVELGLVDEFRVVVQPFIVGEGRRLFDGVHLAEKLKLNLIDTRVFESGIVALRYAKS